MLHLNIEEWEFQAWNMLMEKKGFEVCWGQLGQCNAWNTLNGNFGDCQTECRAHECFC